VARSTTSDDRSQFRRGRDDLATDDLQRLDPLYAQTQPKAVSIPRLAS